MVNFTPSANNVMVEVLETSETTTGSGLILQSAEVQIAYKIVAVGQEVTGQDLVGSICEIKITMCSPLIIDEKKYLIGPVSALLGVYND